MSRDVRNQILAAAVICVGQSGLTRTSLDEVAREAQVGRATVYRHFPGGRDELIAETISWEVLQFFQRLASEVVDAPDLATRLELGLMFAHRELANHEVFQKVLETEPERLLPHLSTSGPLITAALTDYLHPFLQEEMLLGDGEVSEAANYLARMVLSFILGGGSWDLTDPAQVHLLVCDYLLAGVSAPTNQ